MLYSNRDFDPFFLLNLRKNNAFKLNIISLFKKSVCLFVYFFLMIVMLISLDFKLLMLRILLILKQLIYNSLIIIKLD